ncbi:MAG: tetratricopeptide repeat protein [Woeseiaceae bacterium]
MLKHMFKIHLKGLIGFIFFLGMSSVNASGSDYNKIFLQAQNLASKGEITEAIKVYQNLIRSNPLLPEAYNNLAALHLKQKDIKQAKFILEQGIYAHRGYGVLYESLTSINVAMARDAYSKALQINLKPSNISIASLSLDDKTVKKNTIVISETSPQVKKPKVKIEKKSNTNTLVMLESKPKQQAIVKNKKTAEQQINNIEIVERVNKKANSSAIIKTLRAWAVSWSAQATNIYLSFYHEKYKPLNGMSRKGWVQSRYYRLKKPKWIKVALADLKIIQSSSKQAVVRFKQQYTSNSFRDTTVKQMVLINTKNGWRIYREKSL